MEVWAIARVAQQLTMAQPKVKIRAGFTVEGL
jgi:hypothetical protein